jgi:hypothetical protein
VTERTEWYSGDLGIHDEPLALSLLKYRQDRNRHVVTPDGRTVLHRPTRVVRWLGPKANLVSSKTEDGQHMPIIDLDFPHQYVPSTQEGHGHLYLNVPISRWRWHALMWGLFLGNQIELGYFVWSLRRGGNFVRTETTKKTVEESGYYTYGWFRKLRDKK